MTRYLGTGVVALVGFAALVLFAPPAPAASKVFQLEATLEQLTGRDVDLRCKRIDGGGTAGTARPLPDGRAYVALSPDTCRAATTTGRVIAPAYPSVDTGTAVKIVAHEAAHARGIADEDKAECLGMRALRRTALLLGFDRSLLPQISAQARATTYCTKGIA